ncbi:GGDEF and EAL domain-containing protein [Paenisporosarcina cavernae]|uniref:EAL domain-containing protein n=1 Tax=Paenisporosarcina cavernae TaxID=2320858 RepID=A0A385YV98_9BACL|nr:GGDEF and EAL domain-containing protein [Paenisporosarcina cavernae]AYC30401.1 EAL domain-containing protein [Paenisporosarcina cavernae]
MSNRIIQAYLLMSLILCIVIVVTIWNYHSTKEYVLETVQKETEELLSSFTDETNKFSNERVAELELIADYLVYIKDDQEKINFLEQQRIKMPFFTSLGFVYPDGKVLAADGSVFQVNQRESFERALQGEVVYSDLFPLFQDPSQQVTAIRLPIRDNGEIIGVLSGVINMGNILGKIATESNLPGTLYLYKDEQLVMSTKDESIEEKLVDADWFIKQMNEKDSGQFLVDENAAHYVMFQRAGADWTVVVDSFSNDLEDQISHNFWRNTAIVAITLLFLIGILLYIRRNEIREENMLKIDLLTNLPNRVLLEETLKKRLDPVKFEKFTLFFINIDRFKEINERNGYQLGDRVLFEISKKIQSIAAKDCVYRVGGDEFVILLDSQDRDEMKRLSDQIVHLMEEPIVLSTFESLWVTLSVGIRLSELGDWPDLIMQDATFAVQEAKKLGGNRAIFFSQELANQNERHRLIANNVVHALKNNEYYIVYQPIYELDAKRVTSYEALIRWESPLIGTIAPLDFIPLLEQNDLIIPVGKWIMQEVVGQIAEWDRQGKSGFHVAVNISVKQMMHPDFIPTVKEVLTVSGIQPQRLMFEITESVAVQNIELAKFALRELNELGVQTALDDFGTGYSSLSILKELPIDHVKIDRSFIVRMETEGDKSGIILQGVLDIVRNLGMTTVMEGVETEAQLSVMKEMGAHKVQGYLIGRPMIGKLAIDLQDEEFPFE